MTIKDFTRRTVVALGLVIGGAVAASAATTTVNLGFAIDHSGSLNDTEYTLQKSGLANALDLLVPTGNVQYRVAVITFGSDVKTLVEPKVITAANIAGIKTAITTHVRTNTTSTQTDDAIRTLTAAFSPFGLGTTLTLFNLSTDGEPTNQTDTVNAANAAIAAGVDGISVELIGTFGNTAINRMLQITSPKPSVYITNPANLPDPTVAGFVFGVSDFDDYEAAIGAKVQKIIDVPVDPIPLPAAAWLLISGMAGLGIMARKRRAA